MNSSSADRRTAKQNTAAPAAVLRTSSDLASHLKLKQRQKLRELRTVLVEAGLLSLDQQAQALNLGRSTTWVILHGQHKASGLSAKVVKRMLGSSELPPSARSKLLEYVEEKLAGAYGHPKDAQRYFKNRFAVIPMSTDNNLL